MTAQYASRAGLAMDKVHRQLEETNPDPVLVRDAQGKILYANMAFARLFDLNEESITGQIDKEVLSLELLEVLSLVDQRALSTGSLTEHQYDVHRGDLEQSYLIRHVQVQDDGFTCTVFRDITDRVGSVRQMELLKEQAEAASLVKSRFLANMSHELRTPLNSIIGYSELLLEDSALDWEQSNDISRIRRAGAELLQLVDEVLDFSRLESSQADVYPETIRMGEFVQDLRTVIDPMVRRGGNRLVLNLERMPELVRTDPEKLEKILLALLNNACKFTHGGTITLTIEYSHIQQERWISFKVSDTGIGIPSSELMAIFDPFRQVDESSTRNYSGSGLGLNISQQFSRLLGGDIQVNSEPGKGSVFTLRIPDMRDEETPEPDTDPVDRRPESLSGSDKPLALVIEDNREASDLISRHLMRQGCRVAAAMEGVTGKEMAVELEPDVVTLALEMQFIDGWAVLQHLKADSRTREIPVVICSNIDERKRGFARGIAGYLRKPVTATAVRQLLEELPGLKDKLKPA